MLAHYDIKPDNIAYDPETKRISVIGMKKKKHFVEAFPKIKNFISQILSIWIVLIDIELRQENLEQQIIYPLMQKKENR